MLSSNSFLNNNEKVFSLFCRETKTIFFNTLGISASVALLLNSLMLTPLTGPITIVNIDYFYVAFELDVIG